MSEMFYISNKRVLLVGATGALGRVYASALAKQGARLVLADTEQYDVISYAQELGV
jgi:NAD(P)-dependent dehydrogenase (short-subunit alcohol dehydrogenase family)